MSSLGPVTYWIAKLKAGDHDAAQRLWQVYFQRLVRLADKKLQSFPRRAADEEDVALSAFASFCRGAERGLFPQLSDRDNLWPLLIVIAERKAADLVNRERRQKRGGGKVKGESALDGPDGSSGVGMGQIQDQEPSQELAVELADQLRRLVAVLNDEELRSIALWKLEGYSNSEIAVKLGCVPRTVQSKLRIIRDRWQPECSQ